MPRVSFKPDRLRLWQDEHLLTVEELAARYKTSVNIEAPGESHGLASADAQERLERNGLNRLTPPKDKSAFVVFLGYLCNLFNLLLLVSGVLNYLLLAVDPVGNKPSIIYGSILVGVAFLNAAIEYYQEAKSAAILKGFMNLIPANATAMRDGKLSSVQAQTLVVGDVVFTRLGDKVPADLALFHTSEMKVDNSSLTGESEPQERKGRNAAGAHNPLEAPNLAFNGTLVVAGEGYGVVVRTGDNTVLGQIAGMTQKEKKNPSPMSMEIDHLVKITAAIAIVFAIIFFGISFTVYSVLSQNINFAIGVLVAFVPQGLPATVTMLLTIAAKRMSKQNVLIKDLQGVETLGAITLLATDKTGTLTRNQMTVTN
ncbi:MAG: E1-E2 ATPase-domain-containing protein, partial [Olpidium bornovanus]